MLVVIVGCEVAFWVLLGAGLAVRYLLRRRRLSTALLWLVPLTDVVLLAVSIFDLRDGAKADSAHGLAALYIGFSVMFGHRTIQWCDAHVAHRFADGPRPWKPPKRGRVRVRYEVILWLKLAAAYVIAWAVTGLLILAVGQPDRTRPLVDFMSGNAVLLAILALWPITYALGAVGAKRES
ncbi:MAG TPA: hypothetical protein VE172_01885 [Stackebrandtia sp.]|uniref:hypothetical protein n=1 Tax=Stackebrandtia sp. TaxID=2023065 RepID=UPI002D6DE7EE|nr:hypothetical protein [Stackebrandtia sp.]HZE37535.1 hypothetical protein [Stackebrandtia sp.]